MSLAASDPISSPFSPAPVDGVDEGMVVAEGSEEGEIAGVFVGDPARVGVGTDGVPVAVGGDVGEG